MVIGDGNMIIQCTKKLADTMKKELQVCDGLEVNSFYAWHANICQFGRTKYVLMMNNRTRYCIVLYGIKVADLKKFDIIAKDAIEETFLAEGFEKGLVDQYMKRCEEVIYTKTHDRSVLGQMKDFDISISWQIEDHLSNEQLNMVELNKWIGHRLMCGGLNYAHPIDLLREEMRKIEDDDRRED